jgi:TetR/AcrR family transcriptional regulator, transcriptional repressor for nem operon
MRYPRDHKADTRKRILSAAARLFRERGYDGVGVDAIMNEVGLTAGGFYAHFDSKETLFAEAIETALAEGRSARAQQSSALAGMDPLQALIKSYLSRTHRDQIATGCPLPSLTPDVARSGEATRESYEQQFLRYLIAIESMLPEDAEHKRETALGIAAQCIGGLMIARAVKDEKLSDQILKASRQAATKVCDK